MSPKTSKNPQNSYLPSFVVCEPGKEEKEQMIAYAKNGSETLDVITKAVDSGFKFSCSLDSRNHCVGCYLTGTEKTGPSNKLCLSARGPDMWSAMGALAFKFSIMLDCDLSAAMKQQDAFDIWG